MPTLEERIADLEAKMNPDFRDDMVRGFDRIADLFAQMEKRFEQRFDDVDKRLDRLENRFERLDDKVDRHFSWVVDIQFTMMIVFIGALAAAYFQSV